MKTAFEKYLLLILLIIADLVFVLLHILHVYTELLPTSLYSLTKERGYSEFFQFTKELWIVVLLILFAVRKRKWMYIVFSFLFLYFLLDDAFEYHENFGEFLAQFLQLQPALGLRAVDFGELIVSATFGLLFIIALGLSYSQSTPKIKSIARYLFGLILLLAGFGVALDMLGIMIEQSNIEEILIIFEETGEMMVMSIICWSVFHLNHHDAGLPFVKKPG